MKIDMMESLGYSFLRHVQRCWIVQTNWKWPSAAFEYVTDELEREFERMNDGKKMNESDTSIFGQTKNLEQLLKHAELDALGVTRCGQIHALEAAFHEEGLRYGKTIADTVAKVKKKMLRTYLVLKGLGYSDSRHIWFLSPKVQGGRAAKLDRLFEELKRTYRDAHWHLCINGSANDVLRETLSATRDMSDTSELLLRANTLLRVVEIQSSGKDRR